jgi:hypothetical protein
MPKHRWSARDIEVTLAHCGGIAHRFLRRQGDAMSLSDDDFHGAFLHGIATLRFHP